MLSSSVPWSLGLCHPTRVARPECPLTSVHSSQGRHGGGIQHSPSYAISQPHLVPHATAAATLGAISATAARHVPPAAPAAVDLGYPHTLASSYVFEDREPLGKGGNGVVRLVREVATGKLFACKSILKELPAAASVSEIKRQRHLDSIRREVEVLMRLRRCLNVVELQGVFEDSECVHLVMTHCSGGELWRSGRHYSERTAASYMRAVLRTVAQCHAHHILHRDIKPGNFLFLDSSVRSPLLAIDFGMALPYTASELPRSDLGLEGTPWFMAPEVLAARVGPPADVWAAGVTAFQMLTGRVPFDDRRNPSAPSVSAIWRSILTDEPDFKAPYWRDVSPEARDFVASLLHKDPSRRPTARQALQHPWLHGKSDQRATGRAMGASVIQHLQRWGQASRLKQNVLQDMATNLLAASESAGCVIDWPAEDAANAAHGGGSTGGGGSSSHDVCALLSTPGVRAVQELQRLSGATAGGDVSRQGMADALRALGLRLDESEIQRLVNELATASGGAGGHVDRALLVASQLDWRDSQCGDGRLQPSSQAGGGSALQGADGGVVAAPGGTSLSALSGQAGRLADQRADLWRTLAHQTFMSLDLDGDGVLQPADLERAAQGFVGRDAAAATAAAAAAPPAPGDSGGSHHASSGVPQGPVGSGLEEAARAVPAAHTHHDVATTTTVAAHATASADAAAAGVLLPRTLAAVAEDGAGGDEATGEASGQGVDFEAFLAMLKTRSYDSLDLYDGRSTSSEDDSNHSRSTTANDSTHNGRLNLALKALQQQQHPHSHPQPSAPSAASSNHSASSNVFVSAHPHSKHVAHQSAGGAAHKPHSAPLPTAATPVWRFHGSSGSSGAAGNSAKTVSDAKAQAATAEKAGGSVGGTPRPGLADASVRGSQLYTNAAIAGSRAGGRHK